MLKKRIRRVERPRSPSEDCRRSKEREKTLTNLSQFFVFQFHFIPKKLDEISVLKIATKNSKNWCFSRKKKKKGTSDVACEWKFVNLSFRGNRISNQVIFCIERIFRTERICSASFPSYWSFLKPRNRKGKGGSVLDTLTIHRKEIVQFCFIKQKERKKTVKYRETHLSIHAINTRHITLCNQL